MPAFFARGTQKPPAGALLNLDHPFARDLLLCLPFNEGRSSQAADGTYNYFFPLRGTAIAGSLPPPPYCVRRNGTVGDWGSNREGACLAQTTDTFDFILLGVSTTASCAWLPTTAVTVCVIRRKRDTTNRNSALFQTEDIGATSLLNAHCPFSDGVVYFDFGWTSYNPPNRLTVSGLSFSTTVPEKWIFTGGPLGSSIWQNGIKVASQSTAVSRTNTSNNPIRFGSGAGGGGGTDAQDLNYFAIYAAQWSDDMCRAWSAEPYAHLYAETCRRYLFLGGQGSSPAAPSQLGLLGVG